MLQMMLTTPSWSLKVWKVTIEEQLGSWALYLPGMKNTPEVKDTQSFEGVIFTNNFTISYLIDTSFF